MLQIKLLLLIIGLFIFIYACDENNLGTHSPYIIMHHIIALQGNITSGTIKQNSINSRTKDIVKKLVFVKGEVRDFNIKQLVDFNIKQLVDSSDTYKIDDIYIGKKKTHYGSFKSKNDNLSEFLQKYTLTPSSDFQGTMHIFLNFTSLYRCGLPDGSCDVRRVVIYGKELATALKNRGITYIGKNNTRPVGAQEPVVIDHTAEPDSVRALMKAAITTKDPRLLVIKRKAGDTQVKITAFGKEEKKDYAGETYEWKFGEKQLAELRKFVVKR